MRRPSSRQIEAFRAVVLTGSISRGADYLGLTQPAVSRLVRDLEHQVGMSLFLRRANSLSPTAEAAELYRHVERHFQGVDQIDLAIRRIRDAKIGALRIACNVGAAVRFLPRVVAAYLETHPDADITLHNLRSEGVLEGVSLQNYDIGLARAPASFPGIEAERIDHLYGKCAVPADHALSRREVLTPEDLRGQPLLSLGMSNPVWAYLSAIMQARGLDTRVVAQVAASESLFTLVALGCGIGIVDPFAAYGFSDTRVVLRPFRPALPYPHSIVFPAGPGRSRQVLEFAALIRQRLSDVSDPDLADA